MQEPRWGDTTLLRQSSQYSGIINGYRWSVFPDTHSDFLVCNDVQSLPGELLGLSREKRVFIMHENPSIWRPQPDFLDSYGIVISPFVFDTPRHIRFIQAHAGVPWFYGIPFRTDCGLLHKPQKSRIDLDAISSRKPFTKRKAISMIVSGKACLAGHQWRLSVAQALSEIGGTYVDFYGFGHNALPDKAAALDEYRFSVVIENSDSSFYWTEKLADCLLGGAMPIYSGAKHAKLDLGYEFPEITFGDDPMQTARKILSIAENTEWSRQIAETLRNRILHQHNFLSWIPKLLIEHI